MPEKARRMKSDLLYRLCSAMSDGTFQKLKVHNDGYGKGSLQWQLVMYYRNLDSWSREREKADWKDQRLADLKYNTLTWLMKALGRVGTWSGSEVLEAISEVSWVLDHGDESGMLVFLDDAKEAARAIEHYSLWLHLLRLERRMVTNLPAGGSRSRRMKKLVEETEYVLQREQEEYRLFCLRQQYFEEAKSKTQTSGSVPTGLGVNLEQGLKTVKVADLVSGHALLEYYDLLIAAQFAQIAYSEASTSCELAREVYRERPWLVSYNPKRYFKLLKKLVSAYAFTHNADGLEQVLSEFAEARRSYSSFVNFSTVPFLKAYFYLNEIRPDLGSALSALDLYQQALPIVQGMVSSDEIHRLHFFAAKTALDLGKHDIGRKALETLLDTKSALPLMIHAHCRVMILLCYWGQKKDEEMINAAAIATSKFLHRQESLPQILFTVTKAIIRLAKVEIGSTAFMRALDKVIDEMQEVDIQSTTAVEYRFVVWFRNWRDQLTSH